MPRNMSFSLTTDQIRNRTKTVTRRLGWSFLRPGDIVNACVKCMGLKPGEKIEKLCQIRIVSNTREILYRMGQPERMAWNECRKEGFPDMAPEKFVEMFCRHMGCEPDALVNRIEFEYLEEQ